MGVVDGLSKARMLAIEAASVVGGSISSGHLILTKFDGSTIDAGNVVGPAASINSGAPGSPISGQMFFDSANFAGLTDLMAVKNPESSTANWIAYGFGYDTAVTFSVAGGGVTLTGGAGSGNHFAGIPISGLSPGESYFAQVKVRVPTGSPDVAFTVGYKTSGHLLKIKDQDVTLALAFTADSTSASFGIEFSGAGPVVVKSMKVWVLNQRGYPSYIFDGSGWIETVHMAQKGDIYSRVNTFGNQVINGIKQFVEGLWVGPQSNSFLLAGSNNEAGALPIMHVSQDNSAGGFAGAVIRGAVSATAVGRSVGLVFKHSNESSSGESNKGWEVASYAADAWANTPSFIIRNGTTGRNSVLIDNATDNISKPGFIHTFGRGGTTADAATLILAGADAGAGGGGADIQMKKNGVLKWRLYTLGSVDGNLYVRDEANAKMVARFAPGASGASVFEVYDKTVTDQLQITRTIDISGGDANNYYMGGFYNGSGITNAPDANWWYIECQQHSNVASQYSKQVATELTASNPRVFVRTRTGGTWNAWYQVSGPVAWIAPTFTNSWVNYGSGFQSAGYRIVGDMVQLRGLIKSGTLGLAAFTLPAGYRPTANLLLSGVISVHAAQATSAASAGTAHTHTFGVNDYGGRVDIGTTGSVTINSNGANGFVSLDGMSFPIT